MSITKKVHKISLVVDAQTRQLKTVTDQFKALETEIRRVTGKVDTLGTHMKATEAKMHKSLNSTANASRKAHTSMANDIVRHIRRLESLLVGFYALKKAYDVTIGMGHEFNKMMESEKIGMSLIISGRLKHVNVLGQEVSAMDRWIYANEMAKDVMEDVREINVSTPHTLEQTTQIYKTMAGQILAYGGNLEQVKNATKDVSIVSKAMNVDFGQLLKTVDALYSGKMKDSDLKRALQNSVGMDFDKIKDLAKTNKQEAVKYVNEMLAKAKIASKAIEKSWGGVTSNFINAWTDIQAELQKPLFDSMKDEIQSAGEYLKEHKDEIIDFITGVKDAIKSALPVIGKLATAYGALRGAMMLGAGIKSLGGMATKANLAKAGVIGLTTAFVAGQKDVTSFGQAVEKMSAYFEVGFEMLNFMASATMESVVGWFNTAKVRVSAYWDLMIGYIIKTTGKLGVPMVNLINRAIIEPFNLGLFKAKQAWSGFMDFLGLESEKPTLNTSNLIDVSGLKKNVEEGEKLMKEARAKLANPVEKTQLENKLSSYRTEANLKLLDLIDKANGKAISNTKKAVEEVKKVKKDLTKIDFTNPTNEEDEDALKEQAKALKERNKLLREFYKITGQRSELFQLDVKDTFDKYLKDGTYTMKQLSDLYDGMWKKYQEDGKKANKGIVMDFTNQFKGLLEGIFDGDFLGAVSGFFDGVATEMLAKPIKKMSESLSESMSGLFSGLGDFGGILGGLAMSGIGMLFDSFFGEENQTPPVLEDMAKTSESMANALQHMEKAQYPMLQLTRDMRGYLSVIANSFGAIENSILRSDKDFAGNFYQEETKAGTFSSKDYSLYGTTLDFESATVAELMSEQLSVERDTIIKKVYDSMFKTKTTYFHNYEDVSNLFAEDIADATRSLFDGFTAIGAELGVNMDGLLDEVIDIGKIDTTGKTSQQIAEEIEARFSAQTDAIAEEYLGVVAEFQKAGEGLAETAFRVAFNFDQVGHSMGLIGKSVDWRTANIIEQVAGGLDMFNSSMSNYQENFFTDAERYEMKLNTMTKSFASLGLAVPDSKASFRALVESIDTTTDAGASLFAEVISLADGFAEMTSSAKSLGEVVSSVTDAWLGDLSYLSLQQKADLASATFALSRQENSTIDPVDSARAMVETALKTTATKEEYIPIFNEYVKTLQEQAPKATTDDVVAELIALRAEVVESRNATVDAYIHTSAIA